MLDATPDLTAGITRDATAETDAATDTRGEANARTMERLAVLESQIAMYQMQGGFGVTPLVAERLKALEAEIQHEMIAMKGGRSPSVSGQSPSV